MLSEAFGEYSGSGEKAVANYDEDSLTMAVASAMDCISGIERVKLDISTVSLAQVADQFLARVRQSNRPRRCPMLFFAQSSR